MFGNSLLSLQSIMDTIDLEKRVSQAIDFRARGFCAFASQAAFVCADLVLRVCMFDDEL